MNAIEAHEMFVGMEPDLDQRQLYASLKNGFSDRALDPRRFRSIALLTLVKTIRKYPIASRVILFVPPTAGAWIIVELEQLSKDVFANLRTLTGSKQGRVEHARYIGNCFRQIMHAARPNQYEAPPEAWTAFGFSTEDPVPKWLKEGLIVHEP